MELKGIVVSGLAWCLLGEVTVAQQTILNLTTTTVAGLDPSTYPTGSGAVSGGFVGEAFFRRPVSADDGNAGSGIFRDLYRLSDSSVSLGDPQEGYNRDNVMDSNVPNGFDPMLRVVDLVEDSTGTAYVFVIDTNEPGNVPARYLSLDDFRIYLGGPSDPAMLPQSVAGMDGAFGAPRYAMSPTGQQNHILLDYSLYSGSGQMELFVFRTACGSPRPGSAGGWWRRGWSGCGGGAGPGGKGAGKAAETIASRETAPPWRSLRGRDGAPVAGCGRGGWRECRRGGPGLWPAR
jgi:hypothetical protein